MNNNLKIFEDKNVRVAWNDDEEKWYFSVVDVVSVLTDNEYEKAMKLKAPYSCSIEETTGTLTKKFEKEAFDMTERQWEIYHKLHPNAKKENHHIIN